MIGVLRSEGFAFHIQLARIYDECVLIEKKGLCFFFRISARVRSTESEQDNEAECVQWHS
jgi:hypothetical protein